MDIRPTDMPCDAMGKRLGSGWAVTERGNKKGWRDPLEDINRPIRDSTPYSEKNRVSATMRDCWRPDSGH